MMAGPERLAWKRHAFAGIDRCVDPFAGKTRRQTPLHQRFFQRGRSAVRLDQPRQIDRRASSDHGSVEELTRLARISFSSTRNRAKYAVSNSACNFFALYTSTDAAAR